VAAGNDSRFTDARQPLSHSSTHHTGETDALAAHQINGQTIFSVSSTVYSADQTLPANRARQITISNSNASGITVTLPTQAEGTLNGDTYVIVGGNTMSGPITVRGVANLSPLVYNTLVTITATGQQYRLRSGGGSGGSWALVPVDTHTHTGAQVNVGTTANLPLKTGTNGVIEAGSFGTAAGSFCEGNDARLSDARTPSSTLAHKASHATGGTDALAPSDIGAQSIFTRINTSIPVSGALVLDARRAAIYSVDNARTETRSVYLPTSGIQNGDVAVIIGGSTLANPITIKVAAAGGAAIVDPSGGAVTISATGQQFRFIVENAASFNPWTIVSVDTHTHVVADVTGAAASGSITTSGLTQATARILGRTTASTGSIEELAASDVRTFLNTDESTDTRDPNAHAASHLAGTPAVAASYTGSGDNGTFSEEVTITANTAGTAGNSITLTFDGVDDVDTVLSAWNAANPSNQATLDSGDGGQVPDDGDSLQLSGGVAAIVGGSDPFANINQDLGTTDDVTFNSVASTSGIIAGGTPTQYWPSQHPNELLAPDGTGIPPLFLAGGSAGVEFWDTAESPTYYGAFGLGIPNTPAGPDFLFGTYNGSWVTRFKIKFEGGVAITPTGEPITPVAGQIYFDEDDDKFYGYNGTGWIELAGGGGGGEVRSDFVSPYTYTGLADAGTSESTASWTIRRSEFDAGGSFVATLTASAVEWDDRLTASYT
jgi:hypothetical protein